jgi:hypothetical protein
VNAAEGRQGAVPVRLVSPGVRVPGWKVRCLRPTSGRLKVGSWSSHKALVGHRVLLLVCPCDLLYRMGGDRTLTESVTRLSPRVCDRGKQVAGMPWRLVLKAGRRCGFSGRGSILRDVMAVAHERGWNFMIE